MQCLNTNCNQPLEDGNESGYCSLPCYRFHINPPPDKRHTRTDKRHTRKNRFGGTVNRKQPSVPTGTTGAINELIACAYFLGKGYYVYRTQSSNSPCDLIVMTRYGNPLKVEVTTGYMGSSGNVLFPKKNSTYNYDILCVIVGGDVYLFNADGTDYALTE